ncbi:MAG: non-canonical purine NTP pyrophosphatase [Candidatus Marinimicrobia bacterium]|nr:non-canonical purine NTP pyrophosphatase [Candidatus Neomarinimicrobiota bacterium]|tara:strand:+ start:2413 stop:3036 length:624 start_codon:yes stop_codon:yes gene_type:complete
MKLVIATHNKDKLLEIKRAFSSIQWDVLSLHDFVDIDEIVEDGKTLVDNALIKARTVFEKTNLPVLSDDTGLEVDALDGQPGVYTARYAGENCSYDDNVQKLLKDMSKIPFVNRTAQFKTVMVFKDEKKELIVEGVVKGKISRESRGEDGFGYDPIFFVPDIGKTFAEMTMLEKNEISHRGKAIRNLIKSLNDNYPEFIVHKNKEMA